MKPNLQESGIQPSGRSDNRRVSRRRNDPAFTLIELLVVVAIIAVLAALLLPALSMAKNRAQASVDVNNIHQIMLAAQMYANDNDGYLPRPSHGWWDGLVQSWCFSVPSGKPTTYGTGNTRATYDMYYPLEVKSFHSLDSSGKAIPRNYACQFTPYLKNEKLLRCPADIPNTLFYYRQEFITSYCWNGCICYGPPFYGGVWQPGTYPAVTYDHTFKVSQYNSDDILLWENDETLVTDWGQWDNCCSDPSIRISKRHGRGATVGNVDGSAERISLTYWNAMANATIKNRVRCCPVTANGVWW
jgi:prepilin-type N-terminal cleavage/methylation domain-containing protein